MIRITSLLLCILLFSCQEKEIKAYYKVSIVHHEKDFINSDYFHPFINRIKLVTDRVIYKFEDSAITLYFEKEFDTNSLKSRILKETKIGFWHTHTNTAIGSAIYEVSNSLLSSTLYPGFLDSSENAKLGHPLDEETIYLTDQEVAEPTAFEDIDREFEIFKKTNPLSHYLFPYHDQGGRWIKSPILGYAKIQDTGIVTHYLSQKYIYDSLNINDLKFVWESKSSFSTEEGTPLLHLYLVKNTRTNRPYLIGKHIHSAFQATDINTNKPIINLQFSQSGSRIWGDMTERSSRFQSAIAITVNNKVISAPIASKRIAGGKTNITGGSFLGDNGKDESQKIANEINLGSLPDYFLLKKIEIIEQDEQ